MRVAPSHSAFPPTEASGAPRRRFRCRTDRRVAGLPNLPGVAVRRSRPWERGAAAQVARTRRPAPVRDAEALQGSDSCGLFAGARPRERHAEV